MGKNDNDDVFIGILGVLGIVGVTWLGLEILKSFSKKEVVYDCPVCNYPITFGIEQCPNCHSKLTWPK